MATVIPPSFMTASHHTREDLAAQLMSPDDELSVTTDDLYIQTDECNNDLLTSEALAQALNPNLVMNGGMCWYALPSMPLNMPSNLISPNLSLALAQNYVGLNLQDITKNDKAFLSSNPGYVLGQNFPLAGIPLNFSLFNGFTMFPQQFMFNPSPPPQSVVTEVHHESLFDDSEDKKKKHQRPFIRKPRVVRPKVVESKGAVQCQGMNRKKNMRCRNAALMEYFGPRPQYCAEHIDQDPETLYTKCGALDSKGEGKTCKEVVLKEFVVCHKHYGDYVTSFVGSQGLNTAYNHLKRVEDILTQLEREAILAKKNQQDLYQRKNKLIPKFSKMRDVLVNRIGELQHCVKHTPISNDFSSELPTDLSTEIVNQLSDQINDSHEQITLAQDLLLQEDWRQVD